MPLPITGLVASTKIKGPINSLVLFQPLVKYYRLRRNSCVIICTVSIPWINFKARSSNNQCEYCFLSTNQGLEDANVFQWSKSNHSLGYTSVFKAANWNVLWINHTSGANRIILNWNVARRGKATLVAAYLAAVFDATLLRLFPRFKTAGLRPPGLHVRLLHHERLVFLCSSLSIARPVQVV